MFQLYDISKMLIGIMLLVCSLSDIKNKKISLRIVFLFNFIFVCMLPFNKEISILSALIGGSIGLAIMVLSKLTDGQIGMGDGMVLCVTGIGLGAWDNFTLLMYSLFLAAIYSIVLLAFKWADRKKTIPFIPFMLAGFIGVVLR